MCRPVVGLGSDSGGRHDVGRLRMRHAARVTLLDDVIAGASGDASVARLLRQVKVLSSRTRTAALASWVDQELNGYGPSEDVPTYRGPFPLVPLGHFVGPFQSEVRNVQIPPSTFPAKYRDGQLFNIVFEQPIAQIETWAKDDFTNIAWPPDAPRLYQHLISTGEVSPVVRSDMVLADVRCPVAGTTFVGVLTAVRNMVLDLALELERVAPLAGQSNVPLDQQDPAVAVINNHFHGSSNVAIGSQGTSQVVVNVPERDDVQGLLRFLGAAGMSPSLLRDLELALEEDEAEAREKDASPRWTRARVWLSRAATDASTGALGGIIAAAAAGFLGG